MTAKEIIILLSKQAGLTQEQVAARLGFDKANHISVPLSRNDGMGMRLWHTKGTNISHSRVAAYIRASDESYGKPEVWEDIKACLSDMEVEWP